ncbi:unnamed protein product [Brugia timori]|uniref:Uncharacterized protein n=1 Tax=Brugia timori TaxID=42155 RepID=A0A3P7YQX8_9BILA|nr:unnamed protein product [Brugia timori]
MTKLRDDELHHYDVGVENDGLKASTYLLMLYIYNLPKFCVLKKKLY